MVLAILLRRRLKVVTAERNQYAARLKNVVGLIGQTVRIKRGNNNGQSGIVLWVLGNEVGLQTKTEQVTVNLADIETMTNDREA